MARWTTQPPPGTRIDMSHPLAIGLKAFIVPGAGLTLFDAVSGRRFSDVPDNVANIEQRFGRVDFSGAAKVDLGKGFYLPQDAGTTGWTISNAFNIPTAQHLTFAIGQTVEGNDTGTQFVDHFRVQNSAADRHINFENRQRTSADRRNVNFTVDMRTTGVSGNVNKIDAAYEWVPGGTGILVGSENSTDDHTELLFQNGLIGLGTAWQSNDGTAVTDLYIRNDSTTSGFATTFYFGAFWNGREFSEVEKRKFQANPWQIFKPKPRFAVADVPTDVRFGLVKEESTRTLAARLNASTDKLRRSTNLPAYDSFTHAGWFRIIVDRTGLWRLCLNFNSNGTGWASIGWNSSNAFGLVYEGDTNPSFTAPAVGEWFFAALSRSGTGTNQLLGFVGDAKGTFQTELVTFASTDTTQFFEWGQSGVADEWFNGQVANGCLWNRPLSIAELTHVYKNGLMAHKAGLIGYYPFNGSAHDVISGKELDVIPGITYEPGLVRRGTTIHTPINEALPAVATIEPDWTRQP